MSNENFENENSRINEPAGPEPAENTSAGAGYPFVLVGDSTSPDQVQTGAQDVKGPEVISFASGAGRDMSFSGSGSAGAGSQAAETAASGTFAGSSESAVSGTVTNAAESAASGTVTGAAESAAAETASGRSVAPESLFYDSPRNTASGSAYAGSTGGTGSSDTGSYGSQARSAGSAGTGHYYSYSKSPSGGGTGRGPSDPPVRRNGKGKRVLAMVLAVLLVFILGAGAGAYMSGRGGSASNAGAAVSKAEGSAKAQTGGTKAGSSAKGTETPAVKNTEKVIPAVKTTGDASAGTGNGVADVAESVMPSIVSVYNKFTEQGQFFGRTYTQESEAAGSGIIIEETDGELLIVTNNHVVEGADSLSVQFIDEENCEAALKGTDPGSDLAVIAVPIDSLSEKTKESIAIAELGNSDSLRIGEQVIAIGNALGYGQSLTVGYVSALNREIADDTGITGTFIQTDAAINPGNSGGALLNFAGQVIGINSSKIGGNAIEGMGFAIPISKAIPIIDNLKAQESKTKVAEEERGMLGIRGISVTSDVASAYGLPVGAYVEEIIEGSGAAQSELQQGDIITGINGSEITSMESLQQQLTYYAAGSEVTLTVQHPIEGGKYEEKEISLTLSKASDFETGETTGGDSGGQGQQEMPQEGESGYDDFFGFPFGSFGF